MEKIEIETLISAALKARENAYAPYSEYAVGAAVMGADGQIYSGCNVENASYPAGMCAERNAVGAAVAAGVRGFTGMAIVGSEEHFTLPCGICRQVISEFHVPLIITAKNKENYQIFKEEELLPHAFVKENLKES